MLGNYNRYKVMKVFLWSPTENFGLREIARTTYISPPSVMNYLKELEEEGLIIKENKKGKPLYRGNRDKRNFVLYMKISILFELNKSGLIDYLWETLSPQAITLYGSFAKGEATKDSDIDLFILGRESKINLNQFEKILNRKIHIIFGKYLENTPQELKNNILNGIILKGYIKVFENDNQDHTRQRESKFNVKSDKRKRGVRQNYKP